MMLPIPSCPWIIAISMAVLQLAPLSSEFPAMLTTFHIPNLSLFLPTRNMLSLGASKPWPDALEAFNGERVMTGKAIAEFFEPLRVWLEAENAKNDVHIGWTASDSEYSRTEVRS